MLDVLGVRQFSITECSIFLEKIRNDLETGLAQHANLFNDSRQIAIFGDTIVICYPLNDAVTSDFRKISDLSDELPYIVHWGIQNGYLFRGCVSVGDYLFERLKYGNSVLGPAMFEANDWYEKADWFGIILTPTAEKWLKQIMNAEEQVGNNLTEIKKRIFQCDVPIKRNSHENDMIQETPLWTIAWPYWYFTHNQNSEIAPRDIFLMDLEKIRRPLKAERKYDNSTSYFDSYSNALK